MKACFIIQSYCCKFAHALALNLKKKYGLNEFSAYIFMPWAENFIKTQTDIKYDPILIDHEIHERFKKEEINWSYVKYFEETYNPPNGWLYLYPDRKLMMSMGPKEETTSAIDPLYPHEELIKIFQVRAKAIEAMLKQTKPDFIFFFPVGNVAHLLILNIAKKLGIKTYGIDFARIGNKVCLTEDYTTLTGVEKEFQNFQTTRIETHYHKEARKIIDQFKETGTLNLNYLESDRRTMRQIASTPKIIRFFKSFKYLIIHFRNYLKYHRLFLDHNTTQHPFTFAWHKLKRMYRGWVGLDDLYCQPNFQEDYAFFALHFEPETAIQVLSPFYFDQLTIISYIARSLPLHFKLYVKDHPVMINRRPKKYYKELLKIPNVKLIDRKISSFEIIKNAKLVATITGTAGWEASLLGKPVLTFGNIFYNNLSHVKRVLEIEALPKIINELLNNFKCDENETLDFLAAVLKESLDLDFTTLRSEQDLEKLKKDEGVEKLGDLLMSKIMA